MGQLSALFFKNWLLYKRGWLGNIFQLIVPIFFIAFLIMVRRLDPATTYDEQAFITNSTYSKQIVSSSAATAFLKQSCTGKRVALIPTGDPLVNKISTLITNIGGYTIQNFANQNDFQTYIRSQSYQNSPQICFGVTVLSSVTDNYQYKLRFNISNNPDRTEGPNPEDKVTLDKGIDLNIYLSMLGGIVPSTYAKRNGGMLGASTLVNTAILQLRTGNNNQYLQNNVSPIYQQKFILDNLYTNLGSNIGMIFMLPLLIIYLRQTSSMLTQKETKIRQSMYIMGMKGINYYFSWFCRYFFVFLALHLFGSAIVMGQLKYIKFYMVFIIFILFDIVLIVQNFFIQVFLSRAKIGVVISLLFFILQFVISFIATASNNPTIEVNAATSIIPHAAFVLAFQTMLYAQSYQITPAFNTNLNNYVIGYAVLSFIVNIIVYLLLTWYLDQVIPNEWGAKKHPLFCFFSKESTLTVQQKNNIKREIANNPANRDIYEDVQEALQAQERNNNSIEIVGLRKQFSGPNKEDIVAVNNLTVSMYQGQIFALLGHNGAGKTTTISMLTGMTDPTKGYLSVHGETEVQKIREQLGVCPQHDTLYEDLTVQEHLQLFGSFKGLDGQQLELQVKKLIADVNLQQKKNEYSKNLSGGQKRRLSVAISFAGRSKVIILDQPTSGMDTSARRYIWDLLKAYKNDRIIILTTHFMDEADYLGDRIGIMGEGRLLCCGSSPFLKNKFGVGYSITLTKASNQTDSNPIISVIKKHVPGAQVLTNVATDLAIQLPLSNVSSFPEMFSELDSKKSTLKFVEYGISITTLQEVFLNVANSLKEKKSQSSAHQAHFKTNKPRDAPSEQEMVTPNRSTLKQNSGEFKNEIDSEQPFDFDRIPREDGGCYRFLIHFKATFIKRLRVIIRDLKSFLFELILPFVIILLALFLLRINFIKDLNSKSFSLSTYLTDENPTLIPIGSDTAGFSTTMSGLLSSNYGSQINVAVDSTSTVPADFDKNFLYPKKLALKTLKGGIFFYTNTATSGGNTLYRFNTLVSTRTPSSPLFLTNLATETILRNLGYTSASIQGINHPLPRTYQQLQINNIISGFFAGFIFSIALAFKFASIISFIVKQRQDRCKHQQIVSGMNVTAYWVANFVYDYVLYIFIGFITIGIAKALTITSLTDGDAFAATWMLFIFYGLSYIPLTYVLAFLYKDYGNAQAAYYFITFVAGGLLPLLTFLLRILGDGSNKIGRGIAWPLRLFPPFAFGQGLMNQGSIAFYSIYESNNNLPLNALDTQITKAPIIFMAVLSVVFFALLLIIEKLINTESFMRCFSSTQASILQTQPITEEDVLLEREKAINAKPEDFEILAKQLRKVYLVDGPRKYKVAVDNLSFGIQKGEVFGLLGINGAGKTTTFKMLAGEVTSTSGQSYFNGLKISENLDKVREGLGYCPQFDALVQNLTVEEQLQLYYDLKSLSRVFKKEAITRKIKELDLINYVQRLSGSLSGGNKRKLSVAMAMIGNPRIVFLDQPSTGMDPKARRFMWKVIARVATQKKDATVVLTTHSMEEAEALSSRLGIMVRGNFQCIGTPQHIKSKYGDGLEVQIKLKNPLRSELQQLMKRKNLSPISIKSERIDDFFNHYEVEGEDRLQISEKGSGNYIFYTLKDKKQIEVYTLVQFVQICRMHRLLIKQLKQHGGEVEELQKYQTFVRLKIKGKPNVGKLFEFLQKQKAKLGIQQYTIRQATVEQIFNRFAENGNQTQYGG